MTPTPSASTPGTRSTFTTAVSMCTAGTSIRPGTVRWRPCGPGGGTAMERTTVAVPGGHTTVVWRGGHGSPVVYLHGVMNVSETDPALAALAEQHEVIAPVHPGFADLAELDDIMTVHDLAL